MAGLRVAIAGAGLGGLCLAQGLAKAGFDVEVFERDGALDVRRQGYRLHVDGRAGLALRDCLPPDLFELFLATCGRPSTQFSVMSSRLRMLHETRGDPGRDPDAVQTLSTSANRQTLREILAARLADRIYYDRELTDYSVHDGDVELRFASGHSTRADVLVGADGVRSAVRDQYLPLAEMIDTGSRCIYGKTPLDASVLAHVPAPLRLGFTAIIGGQVGMAAGTMQFRQPPPTAATAIAPDVQLSPAGDYLMWAVSAQHDQFPVSDAGLAALDPGGLHEVAAAMISKWHPELRELVGRADGGETFLVRISTSVPVPPWQPSRVTVLGDAIHAMSPARGSGANTALQDAALLTRLLSEAGSDPAAVVAAIGRYEERMRDYGFAAVAASRQAEQLTAARSGGLLVRLASRLPQAAAPDDRPRPEGDSQS